MTPTEHEDALRSRGLRVTATRLAVLGAVAAHPHATTDTILGAVRHSLGTASTQAVYDVLAALTRAELLHRIEPAGHPARYERRVGDNHHHLVCRTCGTVSDADCAVGQAPCLRPADDHGFVVEEAEVIYWGLCPACASTPVPDDAPPTPLTT